MENLRLGLMCHVIYGSVGTTPGERGEDELLGAFLEGRKDARLKTKSRVLIRAYARDLPTICLSGASDMPAMDVSQSMIFGTADFSNLEMQSTNQ